MSKLKALTSAPYQPFYQKPFPGHQNNRSQTKKSFPV